jgi:hypothetical protein
MQNDIFIVSNKISRIENLLEMYNVYDEDTYMNLHVILDDRNCTYNVESISDKITIHYATDVIAKVKHFFDEEWLLRILDVYGVAIKWLVFPYVHEILNINRAMMIDDDTLLLKPVDHYFFEPYVFYNESALGIMGKFVEVVLDPIYKDKVDITTMRTKPYFSMNSGQVVHTRNDHYLEFFKRAACKDMYVLIMEGVHKYKNKKGYGGSVIPKYGTPGNNRSMGGKFWCIEQNIYAIYYRWLSENGFEVSRFGSDVRIWTTVLKLDAVLNFKTFPAYIHYLPTDKTPLYTVYAKRVKEILREENVSR